MPRNGSGTYTPPPSNPVSPGTVIESTWANDTIADIANALTGSIASNGETVPSTNLPMGGFHHINVGDPTQRNQYATLGMVQDGTTNRVQITGGVDNLIGTLVGGGNAYVAGATISFFAPATNTGSMTLNYNGIGARSLTDGNGLALAPGAVTAGQFLYSIYTGTEFRLLSQVDAAVAADLYNLSITGQVRPPSDIYPALTIATATTVNVPAGSAWIVSPGNDPDESELITWAAQTITMQFLSSSFTTFVVVDSTGVIQQIPGRVTGANFRHFAILGVVEHITGVVNNVITRPSVFGDDGYRARDQASLLANTVINGGLVTPNSVSTLQLDIAQGTVFIPGGTANTVDAPNTFNIPPQLNIQFRTLAGQNTTSALTGTVPVGSYDANGAGVIAALPNPGDATVHRLFYLYGQYVLAYGQQVYSSVENALSFIEWDRTKFKKSIYLADATFLAEIIAIRTATNLNIITQGAVVCPGGINFSIGSPGGIAEAPIDGFPYGRRNAAWFQVLGATSPTINTDATITGTAPLLKEVMTPFAAGTVGYQVFAAANKWFAIETVNPDDKTYFRSHNPASGALRFTTTYDLATGDWTMPASMTFQALGARIRGDFSTTTQNDRVMFQSSTLNGPTTVGAIPNGTSRTSALALFNTVDAGNSALLSMLVDLTAATIRSSITGTGTFVPMVFQTGGAEAMHIDTARRIGVGVTPYPWGNNVRSIDFGTSGALNADVSGGAGASIGQNLYFDGVDWRYKTTLASVVLTLNTGALLFRTAPSGAINTVATLTQVFGIGNTGNTGVGQGPSSTTRLSVTAATADSTASAIFAQNSAAAPLFQVRNDGLIVTGTAANSPFNLTTATAANLVVTASGQLQRSTSSLRRKNVIGGYFLSDTTFRALRPIRFTSKNDDSGKVYAGFGAEDLHNLGLTEFVGYNEAGQPDEVYYQHMTAMLTHKVQELLVRVEALGG